MAFELELILWLQSFSNNFLDLLFQTFTIFGEEEILIVLLGFIYWSYDKKVGEMMGLTIFISLAFNSFIKLIVARPRPFIADSTVTNIRPETATGYSFPSGHTQTAGTTYFSLYYLIKKRWLLIVAIILTTLVAVSRMYLGAHYLSDVLVGGFLGIFFAYLIEKYLKDFKYLNKVYYFLIILSVISVFSIIGYNVINNISSGIFNAAKFYFDSEALMKMLGTISGFSLSILYEKKVVNFTNHHHKFKNLIRFILGISIIMLTRLLLKYVFGLIVNSDILSNGDYLKGILAVLLDFIRYFLMLFIGIGLYPALFKKYNF